MPQYPPSVYLATSFLLLLLTTAGRADERLEGIACRSVHLQYEAPEGVAFHNEMSVDQTADGTYFMACGFRMGYFGIQQLGNGKKVILFSVWDPGHQNNPHATPENRRVKVLYQGDGVRVKRFGGEGTGGQSFFDYDWKVGQTCRFLVRSASQDNRTAFAGYFYLSETNQWKHLVTFSTLAEGKMLRGYNSFVEDFRRNRVSATQVRQAHYGNGWIQTSDGDWQPLTRARFTGDRNPVTNINGGAQGDRFFLTTGGETENTDTKLWDTIQLPDRQRNPPDDLPSGPLH